MKNVLLIIFLGLSSYNACAQEKTSIFLGINPSLTVEPFYPKGDFDVNIFPIVFQSSINKQIDYRIISLINMHFGEETELADVGLQATLPVYFKKRDEESFHNYGFYIGPAVGFSRNIRSDHNTLNLAVEPGYMFEATKHFTINMAIQYGRTFFDHDSKPSENAELLGYKINLGWWFMLKE